MKIIEEKINKTIQYDTKEEALEHRIKMEEEGFSSHKLALTLYQYTKKQ